MRSFSINRVILIPLALVFLVTAINPARTRAEAISPWLDNAIFAADGRYVIASYTGPTTAFWDLQNFWSRLQPVHVFTIPGPEERDIGYAMTMAVSRDGKSFAFQEKQSSDIYLCGLGAPFRCTQILDLEDKVIEMSLSTEGNHLLAITERQMYLLALDEGWLIPRKFTNGKAQCMTANWRVGIGAVGFSDGVVIQFNLMDLRVVGTIRIHSSNECSLEISGDGDYVISSLRRSYDDYEAYLHEIGSTDGEPVRFLDGYRIVRGDSPGAFWYAWTPFRGKWSLYPANGSGKPIYEENVEITTGTMSSVIGVSRTGGSILVRRDNSLYVYDLKSGLPLMVLFRGGTNHVSYGKTLPHRPTGIGSRVPYSQLELLSLGSSLGYSELSMDRKEVLLWSAALTTKRRERNDRVWFDLLSVYQRDYDSRRAYHMLSSLCRVLIQLEYAEYLHDTGNYKDAFLVSRQAMRTLKEAPELALRPPKLDIYAPNPPALVSNYKPVLERELWLVMGNSLAYAGYFSKAELAFWGALEIDPLEWRAHDGLLRVNLGGDEARLDELLDHAQGTLTLRSWRGSSLDGSMDQFFLESFITEIRASEFHFPGSSLNWGEEPIQISSLRELLEDEP